jgi:hypothetical protein
MRLSRIRLRRSSAMNIFQIFRQSSAESSGKRWNSANVPLGALLV